ncbi:MAG: protein translocase subunit SecF, partial [Eubacteriales bacterium]
GALYLVGVSSVKQFALPIIIGIAAGLYSSVCLAGNLWCVYKKAFGRKKKA